MQAVTLDCMKGQPFRLTCVEYKLECVDTALLKCTWVWNEVFMSTSGTVVWGSGHGAVDTEVA
eukprot:5361632-Amphidinium_carterae.1